MHAKISRTTTNKTEFTTSKQGGWGERWGEWAVEKRRREDSIHAKESRQLKTEEGWKQRVKEKENKMQQLK